VSREPGTDESGRPIVAELGRAETPAEESERRAASRVTRRRNQTAVNLVAALFASLGIVLFLVLVVVRPDPELPGVDYVAVAETAQSVIDEPLLVPDLPAGWSANRAQLVRSTADDVPRWEIGLLTPDGEYIALIQGIDANPSWVAGQVAQARAGDPIRIGSIEWTSYDRRDADDPGNVAYALVTESGRSTIVLAGTASDAEFAVLAEAVAAEVER
jgi:hypothetical protein